MLGSSDCGKWFTCVFFTCLWTVMLPVCCYADAPNDWVAGLGPSGSGGSPTGMVVGVIPEHPDGYVLGPMTITPDRAGRYTLQYRENGPNWAGLTGFYNGSYTAPLAPGSSKTWSNIYLWGQNVTLPTPYRTEFEVAGVLLRMPYGYTGHLVLDYVPPEAQWDGPMEFWMDLGQRRGVNVFTLPTAVVTDPLQGTRMHFTVYAPIPEPASLLALATGVAGLAWWKRRR